MPIHKGQSDILIKLGGKSCLGCVISITQFIAKMHEFHYFKGLNLRFIGQFLLLLVLILHTGYSKCIFLERSMTYLVLRRT